MPNLLYTLINNQVLIINNQIKKMRIRDLIQSVGNKLTQIRRFNIFDKQGRNAIANQLQNRGIRALENVELSSDLGQKNVNQNQESQENLEILNATVIVISPYSEYKCLENNPLICNQSQQYLEKFPAGKYCPKCAFPFPLKIQEIIRGRKGLYVIENRLNYRNKGRLYQAIKNDNYQVIIKEYLLPEKYFPNSGDIKSRQETFIRVGNLQLSDGILRDFRLIIPQEAISDFEKKRCYLMTDELGKLPTLQEYFITNKLMDEKQIIRLLDQVLQSLEFLHQQKFLLANAMVENGLIHGNINIESLLIKSDNNNNFFIYLCDFSLWENLFKLESFSGVKLEPKNDLVSLGYVCLYALLGKKINQPSEIPTPQNDLKWQKIDVNLRAFIGRLINAQFISAKEARKSLKNLALTKVKNTNNNQVVKSETKKSTQNFWWLLALFCLLGLGGIIWYLFTRNSVETTKYEPIVKYISNIMNIPEGQYKFAVSNSKFNYLFDTFIIEENYKIGTPSYVFLGKGVVQENIEFINHIQDEINQNNTSLTFESIYINDNEEAKTKIMNKEVDFAIISDLKNTPECENQNLGNNQFNSCSIAYDGIVVFVPFSTYDKSLHKALGGQITFAQLRDIYLGKITKWNQLIENAPPINIKALIPNEPIAIEIFEKEVLQKTHYIEQFRERLRENKIEQKDTLIKDKNQCNTITFMKKAFNNSVGFFDDNKNANSDSIQCQTSEKYGAISFGILAKTFQNFPQCEIYPLALIKDENSPSIQLVKTRDNSNLDNALENCDKEKLFIDEEIFRQEKYPLSFTLAIIYSVIEENNNDFFNNHYHIGEKFAKIMKTEEAQCWLKEAQLIPLQPLKNCDNFF